jgi:protein-S-isoprenylcysteine O-methyltransferase Ste14
MDTSHEKLTSEENPILVTGIVSRGLQIVILFLVQAMALFFAVGHLRWVWGWLFLGIYFTSALINSVLMLRTSPETVAERGRPKEIRNWDKVVGGLWSLFQFLILPVVAGLDVRFGWTPEPGLSWHLAGALGFSAGLGLFGWAMISNAFFSTVVRIQADRGQTVSRAGPYRYVRHPGYLGVVIQSLAIPFLLGSLWALIPGTAAAALMVIRTRLEDQALQAELLGYTDFAKQVRYRLVPGIW